MTKVLITPRGFAKYGLAQVEEMKKLGFEVHYNDTGLQYTPEQFLEYGKDADGMIVGVDKVDADFLSKCPNVKVICKFGVGVDNIDLEYCKAHNIYVGRTIGSNSRSVAELVVAFLFADAKNFPYEFTSVKEGKWDKLTGTEVFGKTLGIIGFGNIGKHIATYAKGCGMKVLTYDAFAIDPNEAKKYGVEVTYLDTIYKNSDYITLHVPLLDSTKNMISTAQFALMKSTVCLINTARGGVVDEEALYDALSNHVIRTAYFDVYSTEPPAQDDKLVDLSNFHLTPHIASRAVEAEMRTCQMSSQIVIEHLQ